MTKTPRRFSSRIALAALALLAALPGRLAVAQGCQGDILANGIVDGADLGGLLSYWGPRTADPFSVASDIDGNGTVDGADLGLLLSNWGRCTVPSWATLIEADPDPAVVTDPALRAAIEATGLAWRVRDTGTQIEMLLVPPGTFQMGCIMGSNQWGCYSWEQPVHQVTLTNAFYLGRYEVTQAQWVATMGSNPSSWQGALHPVSDVYFPWDFPDSIPGYLTATGMRLPTEAEWEFACRAGTQTPFYNGTTDDNSLGALAWFGGAGCEPICGTQPVGLKAANALGFHDMLGNASERVSDWYGAYSGAAETNPTGPATGMRRVVRGGSWFEDSATCRASARSQGYGCCGEIGFRVARNP